MLGRVRHGGGAAYGKRARLSAAALDRRPPPPDVWSMQAIISVLSQLAWDVTVNRLTTATTVVGQTAVVGCGVAGAGYMLWRRRKKR